MPMPLQGALGAPWRRLARRLPICTHEPTAVPHRKGERPTTRCTGARWRLRSLPGARERVTRERGMVCEHRSGHRAPGGAFEQRG